MAQVEDKLGRKRDPNNKNASRTIDLDISFWGNTTGEYKLNIGCATKSWSLPDPDTLKHAHVIIPLADVRPEFVHPVVKKPLKSIAQDVSGKEDFRAFFPFIQILPGNEIPTNGVETGLVLGEMKSKGVAVGKPFTNGLHLNGLLETGCGMNPVALVTGAAKRLGARIAIRLHELGFNVLIHCNTSVTESNDLVKQLNR